MIKSVNSFNEILKNHNSLDWVKNVEIGNKKNFKALDLGTTKNDKSFSDFLLDSIKKVNDFQIEANGAIENLATGKSRNLHETMLMVERADLAFKTMNQIRSKVIDAYKEIYRMQI